MRGNVAVIGCGPAGMLSAYAAIQTGFLPDIFAPERKPSPVARGVYLHGPIPGITPEEPDALINFVKVGESEEYAKKVYGNPKRATSWGKFDSGLHPAWALAPAYRWLWEFYGHRVYERRIAARMIDRLVNDYALVINTAPAEALCGNKEEHGFERRPIWLETGAPEEVEGNTVLYNGREQDEWYRASDLFGYRVTEYTKPRFDAVKGFKVVHTDCDCHPMMLRNGRYGMWTPGFLLHQAFERAHSSLSRLAA